MQDSVYTVENFKQVEYQDYSSTSKMYDQSRYPVGLNEMLSAIKEQLKKERQNSQKTHLLDVGCGTGNYLLPVSQQFDGATGVDLNQGMLAQAAKKIKDSNKTDKIQVINAVAQNLPAKDNSISVVIACQTIHHYGSNQNVAAFLSQARRVLKPGGMLIINHSTQDQVQGQWYIRFSDRVLQQCKKKYIKGEVLIKLAEDSGFKFLQEINTKETCQKKEMYLNPKLYLTAEGRAQDSVWSLYNEDELKLALQNLTKLIEEDKFQDWRMKEGGGDIQEKLGNNSHFIFNKE